MQMRVLGVATLVVVAGCAGGSAEPPRSGPSTTAPALPATVTSTASPAQQPVVATTRLVPPPVTVAPPSPTAQPRPRPANDDGVPPARNPALVVRAPVAGSRVTTRVTRFAGTASPGAELLAAGRYPVTVGADGSWETTLVLKPGGNVARFSVSEAAGADGEVLVPVFYNPPLELRAGGLGRVDFGTPEDAALAVLFELLGPPDHDEVVDRDTLPAELRDDEHAIFVATAYPGHDYARFLRWSSAGLDVMVSDYAGGERPGVHNFNGWIASGPGPHGARLATAAGVGVGTGVAKLRGAYGDAATWEAAVDDLTGAWHFSIRRDGDDEAEARFFLHGRFDGEPSLPSTAVSRLQAGYAFDEC